MDVVPTIEALETLAAGAVAITTRAVAESGVELTFAQWRALVVIAQSERGATVGEIAVHIGSAHSPASRLIARMRRRGLLTSCQDEHDRRVRRVRMGGQGRAVHARVIARRKELLAEAVRRLDPVSDDCRKSAEAIGRMLAGVE